MWDPPRPGIKPMSHALAGGLPTTGPPGKAQFSLVIFVFTIWGVHCFHLHFLPVIQFPGYVFSKLFRSCSVLVFFFFFEARILKILVKWIVLVAPRRYV